MSEQIRPPVYPGIDDQKLPDPPPGGSSGTTCEAPAGFPSIPAAAITQITANGTSHVVTLPGGITAGQLLVLISGLDGVPTISASTWTALTGASNTVAVRGLWKIADGSEGSTVTVTSSASEKAEYWVARIESAHASAAPEQVATATGTATPQIALGGTLTPSWGALNTLWLAVGAWDLSADATLRCQTQPVRYIFASESTTGATDGVGLIVGQRWVNAASAAPVEFRLTASEQNSGMQVAIRPA